MLDKKGQAIIEFVLILPVLIMLIFTCLDFGNIFVNTNELENAINLINDLDKNLINYSEVYELVNKNRPKEISVNISNVEDGYITITLTRKVDVITPGLNLFIDDPYIVSAQRVIKYE